MATSSALKFNAVADWQDEYIRHHIYESENWKKHHCLSSANINLTANKQTTLVKQSNFFLIDSIFTPLLNHKLHKILLSYQDKEKKLFNTLQHSRTSLAERSWPRGQGTLYVDEGKNDKDKDE
ncbi:hypothetical protein OG21DRAFT_1527841 [Imleria badia]|nr:hypothetical protein OG21DRAFT_1527841 [Imleria badia]